MVQTFWYYLSADLGRGFDIDSVRSFVLRAYFLFVDDESHSASHTLYGVFPYWVPTFLLYICIAGQTSGHREAPGNQNETYTKRTKGGSQITNEVLCRPPRNSGKIITASQQALVSVLDK